MLIWMIHFISLLYNEILSMFNSTKFQLWKKKVNTFELTIQMEKQLSNGFESMTNYFRISSNLTEWIRWPEVIDFVDRIHPI